MSRSSFLNHVTMKSSVQVNSIAINDFMALLNVTAKMFSHYVQPSVGGGEPVKGIPDQELIIKALSSFEPKSFSARIIAERPLVYQESWETFRSIVDELSDKFQDARILVAAGYGPTPAKVGISSEENSSGKASEVGSYCNNCKQHGHIIKNCLSKCLRCVPSCGQIPSSCPKFLAFRQTYKGETGKAFYAELGNMYYEANAAAVAPSAVGSGKKKGRQVISKRSNSENSSSSTSRLISTSTSNISVPLVAPSTNPNRPMLQQSARTPQSRRSLRKKKRRARIKAEREVKFVVHTASTQSISADNYLVDTGASVVFVPEQKDMDKQKPIRLSNNISVGLRDNRSIQGQGLGEFCGQPAYLMKQFKNGLLSAGFLLTRT